MPIHANQLALRCFCYGDSFADHAHLLECDGFRSIIFYRDRLGLKLTRRFEARENNAEIAFLEDPDGNAVEVRESCARGGRSESSDCGGSVPFRSPDISSLRSRL